MARRVLLDFSHGLGDAAQFTVILKHLAKYKPDWVVDVLAGRGKHSAFYGLCHAAYFPGMPRPDHSTYDEVKWVGWYENYNGYKDRPNSKVTNSLAEEFHIPYDAALGRYEIRITHTTREKVRDWLKAAGVEKIATHRHKAIVLHYEGNTSTDKKNIGHHYARAICEEVESRGFKTVLLDWDGRSPLPNGKSILNPGVGPGDLWGNFGSGDAETVAALIDECAGFIGIDSGPGKIASSTSTPTVIVWTGHSPLQFHDPAANTLHLVPEGFDGIPPISGDRERFTYFAKHYTHRTYKAQALGRELCREAVRLMGTEMEHSDTGLVRHGPFWVRADNFDQDLVVVQDVYYGDCYRTSLYDMKQWKYVADIGGHIGTFGVLAHHMNPAAKIACVEVCPENITALTANVGEFARIFQAACTYEPGELALLNAVRANCESTGGSVVVPRSQLADPNHPLRQHGYQYWDDLRPIRKVTLEDVLNESGFPYVDCLKLDCEGAEYSILENFDLSRVRFIFGEYHDNSRWEELRARKFAGWNYGKLSESDGRGLFHLVNPTFDPATAGKVAPAQAQKSEPVSKLPEPGQRDIWRYYSGQLAEAEIAAWGGGTPRHYQNAASVVNAAKHAGVSDVFEFACGAGVMSRHLPAELRYTGFDRNERFLEEAEKHRTADHGQRLYVKADWRTIKPGQFLSAPAVVCAFAVFKHFSLSDFDTIFDIFAACIRPDGIGVFDVNLAAEDFDDGSEFHHTHVTLQRLKRALERNGLTEVLGRSVHWQGTSYTTGKQLAETTFTVARAAAPDELTAAVAKLATQAGCPAAFVPVGDSYFSVAQALAGAREPVVICDGYSPQVTGDPVTGALRWYCIETGATLTDLVLGDGRRFAIIDRREQPRDGCLNVLGVNGRHILKIATAAGVGDSAWVMSKLPGLAARLSAQGFDVDTCGSNRAHGYLAALPFIRRAGGSALEIVHTPQVCEDGAYNYAPSQPSWHGCYDLFLQVNGHLERGRKLADWLPKIPTDFAAPVSFVETLDDARFADEFAKRGPYVTFFAGPLDGNTEAGHNRGGVWSGRDWRHVADCVLSMGVRVVLVGYNPGDAEYRDQVLYPAGFFDRGAEEGIGLWELPRTLAVLKRSAGHVGYQSGLGILSHYMGKPCVMFWNRYGVPLNDAGATFREEMACAWLNPAFEPHPTPGVAGRNFFGAIYGRQDAPTVAEFICRRVSETLTKKGQQ